MTDEDRPPVPRPLPDLLSVGTLTKLHGVRGELKLRCSAEHVEFLRAVADDALEVTLRTADDDEFEVTFAHVRGHESAPIVGIDGVEDREGAEQFRGATILVPRGALPEPEQDEYFLADLEGCAVHDVATGTQVGVVSSAASLPANVVLTVDLAAGGDPLLVPLVDDAVPTVDVDARRLDVDLAFLGVGDEDEPRDDA